MLARGSTVSLDIESKTIPRVKREILSQWRQSGWAPLQLRNKGELRRKKWVGTTFKVGDDFLGLPMHEDIETPSSNSSRQLLQPVTSAPWTSSFNKTVLAQTYHTALQEPSETRSSSHSSSIRRNNGGSKSTGSDVALIPATRSSKNTILPNLLTSTSLSTRAHTSTQLVSANVYPDHGKMVIPVSSQNNTSRTSIPLRSALHRLGKDGASKSVQFSTVPQSQLEPVSPSEVLARRASSAPDTSAGAAATQLPDRRTDDHGNMRQPGDIVRQGILSSVTSRCTCHSC